MDSIEKLKELFSRFPTIGGRTASRFVFYILSLNQGDINNLVKTILEVKKNIKFCSFCFNPFEGTNNLCQICQSNSRNRQILCIVEKEADLNSIEKTKKLKDQPAVQVQGKIHQALSYIQSQLPV